MKKGIIFSLLTLIFSTSFCIIAHAGVGEEVATVFENDILGEIRKIVDSVIIPIAIFVLLVIFAISIAKMAVDHHKGNPLNYWSLVITIICLVALVVLGGGVLWNLASTSGASVTPPSSSAPGTAAPPTTTTAPKSIIRIASSLRL